MRSFLLALPLATLAGCGPQLAFVEGDDLPPPAQVGQPVLPAMPMRGSYEPMRAAPQGSPRLLAEPAFAMFEVLVEADAGEVVDAGEPELDAGSNEPGDAGETQGLDAGTAEWPDAGWSQLADAGSLQPDDAGSAQPLDAGSSQPLDAGSSQPVDAGSSHALDAGAVQSLDAGSSQPLDAGSSDADAGAQQAAWDGGTNGLAISVHLSLGVPDDSSVGVSTRWLLLRAQLATSYDTTRKVPRWSSWTLDATNFGTATRATSFRTDPQLPAGVPQAKDSDYVNSGFDRGHLCPSADRTATDADNDATFFLTNVVPQTHTSNAGPWLDLEDEARAIARTGKKLVIIAGPIFGATQQSIGTGVQVPLSMFKVAVILDGDYGPASVTSSTKVYAAIVPNASVLSGAWRTYQVSIDEVERQTGLDFLADVTPALQAELEAPLAP